MLCAMGEKLYRTAINSYRVLHSESLFAGLQSQLGQSRHDCHMTAIKASSLLCVGSSNGDKFMTIIVCIF